MQIFPELFLFCNGFRQFALHEDMVYAGFDEGFADHAEAEVAIEGDGCKLGVDAEDSGALASGFGDEMLHEDTPVAFAPVGGEHASGT